MFRELETPVLLFDPDLAPVEITPILPSALEPRLPGLVGIVLVEGGVVCGAAEDSIEFCCCCCCRWTLLLFSETATGETLVTDEGNDWALGPVRAERGRSCWR